MTVSVAFGFAPVPSFSTRYCRPEAVVLTPGLPLLAARKSTPAFLFLSAATFCSAMRFCCSCCMKAWRTSIACSCVSEVFSPLIVASSACCTTLMSISSLICTRPRPMSMPTIVLILFLSSATAGLAASALAGAGSAANALPTAKLATSAATRDFCTKRVMFAPENSERAGLERPAARHAANGRHAGPRIVAAAPDVGKRPHLGNRAHWRARTRQGSRRLHDPFDSFRFTCPARSEAA